MTLKELKKHFTFKKTIFLLLGTILSLLSNETNQMKVVNKDKNISSKCSLVTASLFAYQTYCLKCKHTTTPLLTHDTDEFNNFCSSIRTFNNHKSDSINDRQIFYSLINRIQPKGIRFSF
jgi:hypothetical protein